MTILPLFLGGESQTMVWKPRFTDPWTTFYESLLHSACIAWIFGGGGVGRGPFASSARPRAMLKLAHRRAGKPVNASPAHNACKKAMPSSPRHLWLQRLFQLRGLARDCLNGGTVRLTCLEGVLWANSAITIANTADDLISRDLPFLAWGESKGCLVKGCLNLTKGVPKAGLPTAGTPKTEIPRARSPKVGKTHTRTPGFRSQGFRRQGFRRQGFRS